MKLSIVVSSLSLVWVLAGCSSSPQHPGTLSNLTVDSGTMTMDAGDDVTSALDAAVLPPATLAGDQLAWVLDELNGNPSTLDVPTVNQHFNASFLAAVPFATLVSTLVQVSQLYAPVTLVAIEPGATNTSLVADLLSTSSRQYLRLSLQTDSSSQALITGMLLQPDPAIDPSLTGWSTFDTRFTAVAPRARMLAAEITSGSCVPVHSVQPTGEGPLGSEFKLYVLATLASQIQSGMRMWTDPLAIQDDWKSLPSGTWQNLPAGTVHTLQEFATEMISVSDNTAADHLLHTVGHTNVEAMVSATGHAMPSLDVPFLTTRELFQLKLSITSAQQQMFIADDAADRETFLTNIIDPMDLTAASAAAATWIAPMLIDQIEWFASPQDICNVMLHLKTEADATNGMPVYDILSVNPGLPVNTQVFPYVGYKGGSEPGVMTMSWLLRRNDNRWFVISTAFSDPNNPINESEAEYMALAAIDFAGQE